MKSEDLQIQRQSVTLRSQVEDKIRVAIANGVFKPGRRLVERELCEQIGVGRTSVREALRQLEAEGLVTSFPHRGPVVSTLSAEEARDMYAVRALLEGYAGRMFAKRRTAQELNNLDHAHEQLRIAAHSGLQRALVDAKSGFYGVLLIGSGNPYVKQMLTILHNRINLLRATSMLQPGRLAKSLIEIQRIVKAIHDGDEEEAQSACVAHIEAAAKVALKVLETRERVTREDESPATESSRVPTGESVE